MQGHPIQALATKEHTSHSRSRAAARPITPARTVDNLPWGKGEKKSPIIGIFEPKLFSSLSLAVLLAVGKPCKGPHSFARRGERPL